MERAWVRLKDKKVNFQVIFENEWQNKINKLFE